MIKTKPVVATTPPAFARALGLSGTESHVWQVQHALLKRLRRIVRAASLTHAEVAQRGGSSRTRVTSILNGNLDNVSSDLLIHLASALGYRVRVSVSRIDSNAQESSQRSLKGVTVNRYSKEDAQSPPHYCSRLRRALPRSGRP